MSRGQRFDPGPAIVEVPVQTQGCLILEFGPENNAGRAGFNETPPVNLPGALMSLPDWTQFIQKANDIVYQTYEKGQWNFCNARLALIALPCMLFGSAGLLSFLYLFFIIGGGFTNFFAGILITISVLAALVACVFLGRSFKSRTDDMLSLLQLHCSGFNEVCLPKGLMWRVSYVETWLEGQTIWLEGNICPWASQAKWPKTMRAQGVYGAV